MLFIAGVLLPPRGRAPVPGPRLCVGWGPLPLLVECPGRTPTTGGPNDSSDRSGPGIGTRGRSGSARGPGWARRPGHHQGPPWDKVHGGPEDLTDEIPLFAPDPSEFVNGEGNFPSSFQTMVWTLGYLIVKNQINLFGLINRRYGNRSPVPAQSRPGGPMVGK